MKRDCEAIVEEMKKVEETRFENVWSEANETITTQIASIKEESKKDTEKMANEVELDHENQIQSLEYETGWLKNQKETADDTIEALRNTLSKKEDQMREMEEEMNSASTGNKIQRCCPYKEDRAYKSATLRVRETAMREGGYA